MAVIIYKSPVVRNDEDRLIALAFSSLNYSWPPVKVAQHWRIVIGFPSTSDNPDLSVSNLQILC